MTDAIAERIAGALERIADYLETLTAPGESAACVHPGDAVSDLSTMGCQRYECDPKRGGCGLRFGSGWTAEELGGGDR